VPILELDPSTVLNRKVARGEDLHAALYPFAALAKAAIEAIYTKHAHTGRAAASWELVSGLVDWEIVSNDPNILSKEYGRGWRTDGEEEGPLHTKGVHALATVLGEFSA
jgi:hypothetical protein